MHIHILFCPAQSVGADGKALPTASLALSLDKEIQERCAGFVQSEIERYSEELEAETPRDDDSDSDKSGSDTDQEDNAKTKKGKKGKGKEVEKSPPPGKSQPASVRITANWLRACLSLGSKASISRLEKEYVFIGVIATFLRAIKAGAIEFRHAATLLSHYGRLGPVFDMCSKVIVDILREEGMYKENGDAVVAVILRALEEVSSFSPTFRPFTILTPLSVFLALP